MTWTNPRKLTGITVDYAVRDAADSQSLDIILGYVGSMTKTFFFPGRSLTVLLSWHSGLGNPKCILSSMIYYSEITVETPSRSHIHTYHEVSLNIANTSSSLSPGIMSSNVNAAEYS